MNIGMILDNEFTGDMRVENEVISLQQAGHQVYVLCFNHGNKADEEDYHGAKIIRIPMSLFAKNKMKGFTNTLFDFYTSFWSSRIVKLVKQYDISAIHAHDLYMLNPAFHANKKMGNKCIVIGDLHENYPEALKYYKFTQTFPGKYVISIPKWARSEKEWIKRADHIITVIEEGKQRYMDLGCPEENISVVANYVNEDLFLSSNFDSAIVNKFPNKFIALYAGGFDTHRGLEAVIKSIPLVEKSIPNFKLVLLGKGRNENDLKQLAVELNVADRVAFEGWQPPANLPAYIHGSDVCLVPHLKTIHTDNTIPHKIFQYMLLKKAVISTNCDPLARIINETNSGFIYSSGDAQGLADAFQKAYSSFERTKEMGVNGFNAVQNKYNWKSTSIDLVNLYKKIESQLS